jgi:Ca2+-binding EF-hand superfamily protein
MHLLLHMLKIATFGTAAVLAISAYAQRPGGFGRGGPMLSPAAQALDTDRDGTVSAEELAAAAASLKALDRNGDGKLTSDEVRPQMGGRGGRGRGDEPGETAGPDPEELVKTLMSFDKNSDGQLSKEEVPERMQGIFERADGDKNGLLSAEEIRKSAQSAAGSGRGRGEGRGPSDPVLTALDVDANGEISAAELAAASTALKKLDRNGDGRLTADEAGMNFGRGRGGR